MMLMRSSFRGRGPLAPAGGGGGDPGTIPLSLTDPRFASNTAGSTSTAFSGTYTNKDWNDNPGYTNTDPAFIWEGDGADVLSLSKCRVDMREGPRIGAGSTSRATLNINETFINCVGKGADHADGIQAYSPGGQALVSLTDTCLRSYTDAEAVSKYGAGFIGSAGFFWADDFQGEVRFKNVLIWGGGRGVAIYADTGTTRVSFEDVYFVPSPGGWDFFDYDIKATGGSLIVDKWINVRAATVSGGVVTPGSLLTSP